MKITKNDLTGNIFYEKTLGGLEDAPRSDGKKLGASLRPPSV